MAERANSIHSNVRRTDELLSQLSVYPTRLGKTTHDLGNLDDLRASINSLDLKSSPKSKVAIKSPKYVPAAPIAAISSSVWSNMNKISKNKYAHYQSSLSPLKTKYETEESQMKLPIDNLLFEKLKQSMEEQETKISKWNNVLQKTSNLQSEFKDAQNMDIEQSQNSGNECIDLQISTLEDLSHDTAPHAFNDNKTIHKISRVLTERQSRLDSDKANLDSKLSAATTKRERYEKELEELTKKLHESRNEESDINTKLHDITVELSAINDQMTIANSMKNKINHNLHQMNNIEQDLIEGITHLKKKMKDQWKQFESKWKEWTLNDITIWITHHGLQLKYDKEELTQNMSNKLQIEKGADLLNLNKNDWIEIGITNARDRQYLRSQFGILTAPPSIVEHFLCPITKQLMTDPVIAADGYTYERASIRDWFANNKRNWNNIQCVISPITGDLLTTNMTF
eukprot:194772_1